MRLMILLDRIEDYQIHFIHFQTLFFFDLVKSVSNIRYEMLVKSIVKTYCISVLFSTPLVHQDVFRVKVVKFHGYARYVTLF